MFDIRISEPAEADLELGFWFYEDQAAGLGDYFLSSLYADIESLRLFAGIHPKTHKYFYKTLSKRFPFAIFYTFDGTTAMVAAVLDSRQKPARIKKHLGKLQ